jgi:hypothetical protein
MPPAPRSRKRQDPAVRLRPYTHLGRDMALVLLAVFIFIHETLSSPTPDPYLIAAGLVMLGLPTALHVTRDDKPPTT